MWSLWLLLKSAAVVAVKVDMLLQPCQPACLDGYEGKATFLSIMLAVKVNKNGPEGSGSMQPLLQLHKFPQNMNALLKNLKTGLY